MQWLKLSVVSARQQFNAFVSWARKRYLWLVAILLVGGPCLTAEPRRVPVQAELVGSLDAGRVKVGDLVFAKVRLKWEDAACPLQERAILKGHVVARSAVSKADRNSLVAVVFDTAECGKSGMKPLALTLAALTAPDFRQDSDTSKYQSLSDAPGVGLSGGMRSLTSAATNVYNQPYRAPRLPQTVLPGQVVGLKNLKLSLGSGPEGSSVLSAKGHNLRLEAGTIFVLVKSVGAPAAAPSTAGPRGSANNPGATASSIPQPADAPDQTDVCNPPQCSVAIVSPETEAKSAATNILVRDLGYTRPPDREIYGFDYDSAIAYLGPNKLLFTFNPHLLLPRSPGEKAFPTMRRIRGIVVDLQTRKVEQSVDWRVLDAKQYLWQAGASNLLVHAGQELRLYGPGLKLQRKFALHGPLAFLKLSPSGTYFAVGVLQERHTESIHKQLAEAEDREPEEDVEITILDARFAPLASAVQSSRALPPELSDEGQIRIVYAGKSRWELRQQTWDGQRHALARVSSTCLPQMESMPPDLLFVVGCDRQADGKWYRVLRPDGKPVFKGWSPSTELEQTANSNAASGAFAVAIAKAKGARNFDAVFRGSDITSQQIGVYRAGNGQRMFAVSVPSPVPTRQTFVLSPRGDQLAVLTGDEIAVYSLPAGAAHDADAH